MPERSELLERQTGAVLDGRDRVPDGVVCVTDFEERARGVLPRMAYDYLSGGAADEFTLRWNVEAFSRIRLRPKVLVELTGIDTTSTLFGHPLSSPIVLAPTAYHRLFHPDGELATARGAAAADVPYCVSTATTTPLAEIAASGVQSRAGRWFQLYPLPERDLTRRLVEEAERTGARVLCLTVDTPVPGARNREQRAQVRLPDGIVAPYFHHVMDHTGAESTFNIITWRDVEWLRASTSLPLVLKGILTGDDARLAVEAGVAGVIVSNHGARNLDTLPATIDALPEVAAAVRGRIPVLLDGGVRRGTDILKAIALGASAVLIGRPYLYALAVAGAAGVAETVRILRGELEAAMTFTGRDTLSAIDRSIIW
jgi:4-hydroxymandelate oxidase